METIIYVNKDMSKEVILNSRFTKKQKLIRRAVVFSFLLVLSIFVLGSIFNKLVEVNNYKVERQLANYTKVEVMVESGDTIWNLVEKVEPNADPREMIYLAEKLAGKSLSNIHPGDVITLLKK